MRGVLSQTKQRQARLRLEEIEDDLSPENLHQDGEISPERAARKRYRLEAEARRLLRELAK